MNSALTEVTRESELTNTTVASATFRIISTIMKMEYCKKAEFDDSKLRFNVLVKLDNEVNVVDKTKTKYIYTYLWPEAELHMGFLD